MMPDLDVMLLTAGTVLSAAVITGCVLYVAARLIDAIRVGLQTLSHEFVHHARLALHRYEPKEPAPEFACLVIHGHEPKTYERLRVLSKVAAFHNGSATIQLQSMREFIITRVDVFAPLRLLLHADIGRPRCHRRKRFRRSPDNGRGSHHQESRESYPMRNYHNRRFE